VVRYSLVPKTDVVAGQRQSGTLKAYSALLDTFPVSSSQASSILAFSGVPLLQKSWLSGTSAKPS
jgi:hypothetical protein